ncbi:hypothetical protein VKT23_016829 [Stygiomarasmius scandens]|uniref:F-box domain-containing protein n=1 Tax=Marasmiellus scandens TaxID=2682957 RepID=A0ABR1IYH2_9AGAR
MTLENSRFAAYFNTNYSASDAEVQEIQELLKAPESQLHQIDQDLARLRSVIDSLLVRRAKLASFVDAHRRIISPIRRIPPEVLTQIFLYCLPIRHPPTRSKKEAPLLLTEICKSWRDVSLCTPPLWDSIHVHIPRTLIQDRDQMLKRRDGLDKWLARSADLPFSLSLNMGSDSHYSGLEITAIDPLVDAILQHLPRCKSLTLGVPHFLIHRVLTSIPDDILPLTTLEKLTFRSTTQSHWAHVGMSVICDCHARIISRTPSLRSLHLLQFQLDDAGPWKSLASTISWANLTELSLVSHYAPLKPTLDILSRAVNLHSCRLGLNATYFRKGEDRQVTLPFLRKLKLSVLRPLPPNFEFIIAPMLSDLYIELCNVDFIPESDDVHRAPFINFLSEKITKLEVRDFFLSATGWEECLDLVPNLTSLKIRNARFLATMIDSLANEVSKWDRILDHLTPLPHDQTYACPKLQVLELRDLLTRIPIEKVLHLASARQGPSSFSKLARVFLELKPPSSEIDMYTVPRAFHSEEVIRSMTCRVREGGTDVFVAVGKSSISDSPWNGIKVSHFTGEPEMWEEGHPSSMWYSFS